MGIPCVWGRPLKEELGIYQAETSWVQCKEQGDDIINLMKGRRGDIGLRWREFDDVEEKSKKEYW